MNRFLSNIIDNYGLYQLHKEKSNKTHFYNSYTSPIRIDEVNRFYTTPNLPKVELQEHKREKGYIIGNYFYKSDIKNSDLSNEYATGLYYQNAYEQSDINIIFVHGWRMDSFQAIHNIYLKSFTEIGYNIYNFNLPYHFARNPPSAQYNGELMVSANVDRTLLSIKQAIADLRAVIHWLKQNRKGKVILIGISLGRFIVNLAGTLETNIDALISVMYANSMAYSVWNTTPGKYIKKDFEQNDFTYDKLMEYWAIINPSLFKPVIPKERILLFSGMYDKYVAIEDADVLWEAWDRPYRIIYPCGHAGIIFNRRKIGKDTINFLKGTKDFERL